MVRLVFRPYTQVGRPICTSGPLRASTRVSSGFALPRHSSPSFGSYRARSCSTSPTERARRAGGAPGARGRRDPTWGGEEPPFTFIAPRGFRDPLTRARVRLLGPCFKTGLVGSRHRRRPLAPVEGRSPPGRRDAVRTHWGQSVQVDSRAGGGGPRDSPGRVTTLRYLSTAPGGNGEVGAMRAVKVGGDKPADPPSRRALPGRPGAGRDAPPRRKCARRGHRAARRAGARARAAEATDASVPGPGGRPAAGLSPPGGLRGPHQFTS